MNNVFTVTEKYKEFLEDKTVLAATFTTFNLELSFFETEIMWLLTTKDMMKFSDDIDVRKKQLAFYYQNTKLPVSVFIDQKINIDKLTESSEVFDPIMEYKLIPVPSGNSAFHPKISFILLRDENEQEHLLFVNGSNNLTFAGWWENIECVNLEFISKEDKISEHLKNTLLETVDFLKNQGKHIYQDYTDLDLVESFIHSLDFKKNVTDFYYSSLKNKEGFVKFLKEEVSLNFNDYDRLEIISPYFAEEAKNSEKFINEITTEKYSISLFLPRNDSFEVLCTEEFYNLVSNSSNNMNWASFTKEYEKILQLRTSIEADDEFKESIRNVHAKIYHWHNSQTKKSVFFFGSVNLSYKAFNKNEEFGKLYFIDSYDDLLLEELTLDDVSFVKEDELLVDEVKEIQSDEFNGLILKYDWKEKILELSLNSEEFSKDDFLVENDKETIEKELQASPFLKVHYKNKEKNIFVHQINFTHKPLDLGTLDINQIIDVYSKLHSSKDELEYEMIEKAIRKFFESKNIKSDTDNDVVVEENKDFFSEYAEIFYGLRNLKNLLKKPENLDRKDYYLKGEAMDSIPSFIKELMDTENTLDIASKYISLLYIQEIYKELDAKDLFNENIISDFENDPKYSEEFSNNKEFISWYKTVFFNEFMMGDINA